MTQNLDNWLRANGLERYAEMFRDNAIEFDLLPDLTDADLEGMGVLLGAEATHDLLQRFFAAADQVVESYGGSVDKHMGDNVMAVFGAPIAHGNDPERAARAAPDIHDALAALAEETSLPLSASIGIANGTVVASPTGSEAHTEYTVTGDAVNLASRLQGLAEPGQTVISDGLHRSIGALAEADAMGPVQIKGLAEPVQVWRLNALAAQGAATTTPIVGRGGQLRQFEGVVADCCETGSGQTVLLRGAAGMGKTRLAQEFIRLAKAGGMAVHLARIYDFGMARAEGPVQLLALSALNLARDASPEARADVLRAEIERGLDETHLVFLNDLLQLGQPAPLRSLYEAMENAARERGKGEAFAALIAHVSQRRPLMLLAEDLHWADAETLSYLARAAAVASEAPVVLAVTARPEAGLMDEIFHARLKGGALTTIDLGPLRTPEAERIARELLGQDSPLQQKLVERAEGNPLFLEELLRNIRDGDGSQIPGTIQSLVLARMDRLPSGDRQALQAAAVIGQRFELDLLRALCGDAGYNCTELTRNHLVNSDGDDFLFAHALLRDGVYASLLGPQRRDLHQRAAAWYSGADAILHAEHLHRADDPGAPAAYLAAAREEQRAYRPGPAMRLATAGREIAQSDRDIHALTVLQAELHRELGHPKESEALFRAALDSASDALERCRTWIGIASCARLGSDYETGMAALDAA